MFLSDNALPYGFRIVGSCQNERRLIDWPAAFLAYAQCDERAEVSREGYLSAFRFGDGFREHLNRTGSTKGFTGESWSRWLWFDIDRAELAVALVDCQKLVATLFDRFEVAGDELLLFFSGSKGFHVGLPTGLWQPEPSLWFHRYCRRFAEQVAAVSNVAIDSAVYDCVRAFRAPNSRHPKTGRHKRILTLDGLLCSSAGRIVELAAEPWPFELPEQPKPNPQAGRDWQAAIAAVDAEQVAAAERRNNGTTRGQLNRSTLAFIRDGAENGNRHRLLFAAAADLAGFGCSPELAWALLSESALDSGLPPADVRRQIECGLKHGKGTI